MLALAILVALVVDVVVVSAVTALFRRTGSLVIRSVITVVALVAILMTTAVASLATATVQARIVMAAMRRQEPMATIIRTDRQMRGKLQAAVREGLDKPGDRVANVKTSVSAVLQPYMAYRLSHAPDRFTIASARSTADMLRRAKAQGPDACRDVLSGNMERLRGLVTQQDSAWLPEMLETDALDQPRAASQDQIRDFLAKLIADRRWQPQDAFAASRHTGPLVCDYPIAAIEAAVSLPEAPAAALLRGMGMGAAAVTAR